MRLDDWDVAYIAHLLRYAPVQLCSSISHRTRNSHQSSKNLASEDCHIYRKVNVLSTNVRARGTNLSNTSSAAHF